MGHGGYVANSGLIINPKFRKLGLAESDQDQDVLLVAEEVPGLETVRPDDWSGGDEDQLRAGLPAVTYSELTDDDQFWVGCQSCVNYPILAEQAA